MSGRVFTIRKLRSSVAQEKRIAKDVGGRRVAGSGSMPGNKGDVKADGWLVEAKQTVKGRFSLTLQLWRKIECEAYKTGKTPAMVIEMAGRSLVVLGYNDWLAMRGVDE
jgi:hypothetical protein